MWDANVLLNKKKERKLFLETTVGCVTALNTTITLFLCLFALTFLCLPVNVRLAVRRDFFFE